MQISQIRRYLILLVLLSQFLQTGCTQATHASIWIEKFPESSGSTVLANTLSELAWNEDSKAGEVIYRNSSVSNCFVRASSSEKLPVELVFVCVGTDHFDSAQIAAFHQIANALIYALGKQSVRVESFNGPG